MLHSIIHFFFVLRYINFVFTVIKKFQAFYYDRFLAIFLFSLRKKNQLKQKQHYGKKKRQKKDFAAYYNENK